MSDNVPVEFVAELADRRTILKLTPPDCPHCGSEQVFLRHATLSEALWRCRDCHQGFETD